MIPPEVEEEPAMPPADPLADLLLNLVALFVLAVLALLSSLQPRPRSQANPAALSDPVLVVAEASGLTYGVTPRQVHTGSITRDPALQQHLAALRASGILPRVVIFPDGLEAAFELETALAQQGHAAMTQIRLGTSCAGSPARRAACLAALP